MHVLRLEENVRSYEDGDMLCSLQAVAATGYTITHPNTPEGAFQVGPIRLATK